MTRFFRPRGGWLGKLVFCAAVAACISSSNASADQHSIRIIEEPQVSQPPPFALGVTLSGVPAIIDEDTIRLAGRVVHIFGIDAPESAHKFLEFRYALTMRRYGDRSPGALDVWSKFRMQR